METYVFLGSDKNAGKTTAMNYIYGRLLNGSEQSSKICLTSIGINGEGIDHFDGKEKPRIRISKGVCFVTAEEHLAGKAGSYAVVTCLKGSSFAKTYVLAQALMDFTLVIEGPNDGTSLEAMKAELNRYFQHGFCLLDGSIDRWVIGRPGIADKIVFALLMSGSESQQKRAGSLLSALTLPACSQAEKQRIESWMDEKTVSLLLSEAGELRYRGTQSAMFDPQLKKACLEYRNESATLYLRSALSQSLHAYLAPMKKLDIVLDNFTLLQSMASNAGDTGLFHPQLQVLHKIPLKVVFLKQETWRLPVPLPETVPVVNLFRDDPDEIRI